MVYPITYIDTSGKDTGIVLHRPEPTPYTMVNGIKVKKGCLFGQCPDRYLYMSHPEVLESVYNPKVSKEGNLALLHWKPSTD